MRRTMTVGVLALVIGGAAGLATTNLVAGQAAPGAAPQGPPPAPLLVRPVVAAGSRRQAAVPKSG